MRRTSIAVIFLALTFSAAAQNVVTFNINDNRGRDVVTFTSKAPLETIVGKSSAITGYIDVDLNNVRQASSGRFEVELATLKTGIEMRDSHMREKFLETDKYPKAVFELTRVVEADKDTLPNQTPVDLVVEGNFTVHGVTKMITVPATVTYFKQTKETESKAPGDLLSIVCSFDVLLSDYNIDRPQFLFLKLDDKQVVQVDAVGSTAFLRAEVIE